jgi:hypothetical protein
VAIEKQDFKPVAPDDARAPRTTGADAEISAIAHLACVAAGAKGCLVMFRGPSGDGSVWAAGSSPPRQLGDAVITELIARWAAGTDGATPIVLQATPSDAAVLRSVGIDIEDTARCTLVRHCTGQSTISAALLSAGAGRMTKAVAELAVHCASALISGNYHSDRAAFWRTEAGKLRDNLIGAGAETARSGREHMIEMAANRRLVANAERGNLPALAAALCKLGPFEGWLLVTQDRDGLEVGAARGVPRDALGEAELRRLLQRRVTKARNFGPGAAAGTEERRFRSLGYRAYMSVPLEGAAILLLARNPVTAAARARIVNSRKTIGPYLRSLFLSRELERQRALVRSLVRGLFATADAERASLRRDLHDDWAQLLAAAQIAVNGNGDDARSFFRELEGELRRRLDALRPPQPGRGDFKGTIDSEVGRLGHAGIQATASIHGHRRLPATVREVFTRVIGEGVSNVIRHAAADRVRIEVECRDGVALASITDNGRGLGNRSAAAGYGLRGLAERVALVGGSCDLESTPGGTRLSARIPVADL